MRTKSIGSCVAPRWFPGPRECDHLLQILDFSLGKKYPDMRPVDLDFSQIGCFLVCQNFCFVWVNFEPLRFCIFWTVRESFLGCSTEVAIMSTSSVKRGLDMQFSFFVNQFDAQAHPIPSFNVFLLS